GDGSLQMMARNRFVERQRLEIDAGLVPRIVRRKEIDSRAAAILGRRIPLTDALAFAKRRVWLDDNGRVGEPPEPARDRDRCSRHGAARLLEHLVTRMKRV